MATTVAGHAVATFATPVNATLSDASVVLGNDNAIGVAYNAHDADPGIHLQSSTLVARPAAATAGRKWMTSDGLRVYYDTGTVWSEIAYLPSVGGTLTGNLLFTDSTYTIGVEGATRPKAAYISQLLSIGALSSSASAHVIIGDGTPTYITTSTQYGVVINFTGSTSAHNNVIGLASAVYGPDATTIHFGKCLDVGPVVPGGSGGVIERAYGVYVNNITLGSIENYAIYTGSGLVRFGDAVTHVGATTLAGGVVSYGANDSGGAGKRLVLVPNA